MDKLSKNNMENVSGGVIKLVTRYQLGQGGRAEVKYYYEVYNDKTGELVRRQRAFFDDVSTEQDAALSKQQWDTLKAIDDATNRR